MQIVVAFLLDCVIGDPKGFPHPVIYIGKLIRALEKELYSKENKYAGAIFAFLVVAITAAAVHVITAFCSSVNETFGAAVTIYFLFAALSFRSLKDETIPVARALIRGDIDEARKCLSMVVGRDTERLDEVGIIKADVETIAEGYVDGIAAPLFWMTIGLYFGCPAVFAWICKASNTLDSMVGYDDDRYTNFGFASAKFDDFMNFIPARIGGFVSVIAGRLAGFDGKKGMEIFFRDRRKHKSPNSAHSEAAFAGLLGISLGGGGYYGGEFEVRPTLGDNLREPSVSDIYDACRIVDASVSLLVLIIFVLVLFS